MQPANALLLLAIALTGCMSLKQYSVTGGRKYDSFGYMEHLHCGLLQVGPSNRRKGFKINDTKSFALAPDGTRVGISTEPHDYDLRPDKHPLVPYVRDRVYLVDANGDRLLRNWMDGNWKFHVVMDSPKGQDTRDFEMHLGTFNYVPLIHGAPN